MRKLLRIAVVGDEGVGKTTLITSLLKERYEEQVPHVLPEISIPAEVTLDKVQTMIVDTSAQANFRDQLAQDVSRADVVCLIYAVDHRSSFERLGSFWIPFIRSAATEAHRQIPVILVGNRIDMRPDEQAQSSSLDDLVIPMMNDYKEIETCIECSAKELVNVAEVFYFASKAVLHPTLPVYDVLEHELKPAAKAALTRIFIICDKDKNDILDDVELNAFQCKVFGAPLQNQELEGVKAVVRENLPQGVLKNGLTLEGFLFLHTMFIRRGRLETIWAVFRKFGYDDHLNLRAEYLCPPLEVGAGFCTELSPKGYQFFTDLFQVYDKDKDGALDEQELTLLFSASPGNPWLGGDFSYAAICNERDSITLQGFLAMWSMTTLLDHQVTLAYLAYLGYEENTQTAIKVIRNKRSDRISGKNNRSVFNALVFGATGCGKSELLKGFVGKHFDSTYHPTNRPFITVNSVEVRGSEKYLVLQEVTPNESRNILQSKSNLDAVDILCFVYDTSDESSFSYLTNLRKQFALNQYPVVFIGTKSDLPLVTQRGDLQPVDYCKDLKLADPLLVSTKNGEFADLYNIVVGVALNPFVAVPNQTSKAFNLSTKVLLASTVGASAILLTLIIYLRQRRHAS